MAQLAIAAVGALALGPVGLGLTTAGTGFMLGSLAYSLLAPGQKSYGPRLNDLKVTGTDYGSPIPWIAGSPRVAGQIIWASERRETATEEEQGKGGGPSYTSYTYDVDLLILLSENQIKGISRIWSNGELVYSGGTVQEGAWVDIRVYTGADDQLPDPTYEAAVGLGNAPAYRGMGTVLIQGLQLGNSGNIPNLTFELNGLAEGGINPLMLYQFGESSPMVDRTGHGFDITDSANAIFTADGLQLSADGSPSYAYARHVTVEGFSMPGDFTLEIDVDIPAAMQSKAFPTVLEIRNPLGGASPNVLLLRYDQGGSGRLSIATDIGSVQSLPVARGSSCHLCIMRSGPTARLYIQGAPDPVALPAIGLVYGAGAAITFGNQLSASGPGSDSSQFTGGINSFRLTSGALYDAAGFEPPARPLSMGGGTGSPGTDYLRSVLDDLSERCGYEVGEVVVSAADTTVRALAIGQVGNTRSGLEALQQVYFLECSAAELIYIRDRAIDPVAIIPFADLGMAASSGGDDEPLSITLGNDLELPAQLALSYPNMAGDYQTATEFSDRLLSGQQSTEAIQTAVGLLPAEAKAAVDGLLMDRVASLATATIKLPLKYARLEPGDVISATNSDGRSYRLRIQSKTDAMPIIELQCVLDDVGAIDSAAVTDTGYLNTDTVIQPAGTVFEALDIPILRDADDAPGFYLAVSPRRAHASDRWPGAVAAQSWDGVNYVQLLTTTAQSIIGTATTELAPWSGGVVFDERSTVTVQVSGELASSTRDAMLLDESINALLLGREILRFRSAALLSGGTYLLSGLLRGQRGTEWAMGGHAAGERCVLLGNSLCRVGSQTNEIGLQRQIKAVTLGQFLSAGAAEDFIDTGVALKPFSPANPRALPDGLDLAVSWQRRTRRSYQYSGPAPVVPLGEAVQAYRVRVFAGGALLRSDVVNETLYRYTADMQAADGLASGAALQFEICQLSATAGPGYPSTVGAKAP